MALPLFFSVIALVIVSTTALVIVRNRVRIKTLSESTRKQRYEADVRRAQGNATISALVNEINTNTEHTNEFATRTDQRIKQIDKRTEKKIGNMDKRLNSYQNITTANFMGMNNRMEEEIGRLDATDDILRDKIAQNRRERIEENQKLDGRITENARIHTEFLQNSYMPFVKDTTSKFEATNSNMDRMEQAYRRDDSLLSERINTNNTDILGKMDTMNTNIGNRIDQLNKNISDVMLDATEMDGAQFTVFSNMISQQQDHTNTNLNTFFDGDATLFSPNYVTSKNFDEWSKTKYYSDESKRLRDMQSTIDKTEEHIDSINRHNSELAVLSTNVEANNAKFAELQTNMQLRNSNVDEQIAAINSSMLTGTNAVTALQSDILNKADLSAVSDVQSNLQTYKADTSMSMRTMQSQVWSNIPQKFEDVNSQISKNASDISGVKENVSDLQDSVASIQATIASNVDGTPVQNDPESPDVPAPVNGIVLGERTWRAEWEPRVQEIFDSSIKTNNASFTTTLLETPAFNDQINDLVGGHSNVVKVSELDQLFEERVLPTLQSTSIQSDTAVVNSMTASNVVIGGTLDATNVNVSGALVVKRGGDVEISLEGVNNSVTDLAGTVNDMKSTFESAFYITGNFLGASSDINLVKNVTIPHDVDIGRAKNLKLSQDPETAEGGFIEVSDLDKIHYRTAPGVFTTLETRLKESKTGATTEDIISQITGKRIDHLYTEADPGKECEHRDSGMNKCKPIGVRLENLETSAAGSSGSGGIDITPFDPQSITTLNLKSIYVDNDAQTKMSFDTSGLTLDSDVTIAQGKNVTINSDVSLDGKLSVNQLYVNGTDINGRVTTLENAVSAPPPPGSLEPPEYVKNITKSGNQLTIEKKSRTDTIDISQASPNGYYLKERTERVESGTDYDTWGFSPYSQLSPSGTDENINLPKNIVTSIDKTGETLNINTFNTRTGTKAPSTAIDLSPPSSSSEDFIKVGTNLALRANPLDDNILQVCKQDSSGNLVSGTCTPLWDHRQAPEPVVSS